MDSLGTILLAALAAFAATHVLGLWRNDFPALYHADEPDKVTQVLSGARNFHHPPLMLEAVDALRRAAPQPDDPATVARIGRTLSAGALAAANAALTLLAGLYGGPLAAILAAGLLVANPHGLTAGHYFKEDSLLALGLALALAVAAKRARSPGVGWSLLLGLAAGLAASTKHIGWIALVHALALECLLPADRRARRIGLVVLGALTAWVALNIGPILWHPDEFRAALGFTGKVVSMGNSAVGTRVPHLIAVGMFFLHTPIVVLLGLPLGWRAWWRDFPSGRAHADRWLLAIFPLALVGVFSFSASTAVRYLLPVTMLAAVAAAAGWADAARVLREFLARHDATSRRGCGRRGGRHSRRWDRFVLPRAAAGSNKASRRDDRRELRAIGFAQIVPADGRHHAGPAGLPGCAAQKARRRLQLQPPRLRRISGGLGPPRGPARTRLHAHRRCAGMGRGAFLESHKRPVPRCVRRLPDKRRDFYLRLAQGSAAALEF